MRLFTGIPLADETAARLDEFIASVRPLARLSWGRAENLHITTKFIGEWPDGRLAEIVEALRALPPAAPIEIAVAGLGWFPNPHAPRVFWAGVHAKPALAELAASTEQALGALGVPAEQRPFRPHLTLARVKDPKQAGPVRQAVATLGEAEFGRFTADRFFLFQSQRTQSGSAYTRLSEFPMALAPHPPSGR